MPITNSDSYSGTVTDDNVVREVLAANAQLLVLARQQRKKKRKPD